MSVVWYGAMPGLRLFDGDELTAWAGLCQVEWSIHGTGNLMTLRRDGHLRVVGTNPELSRWIIETFVTPMSRTAAVGSTSWGSVAYETAPVEFEISLDTGLWARADDLELELAEPLDRQLIYRDAYDLDGVTYRVSFVNVSCATGKIAVAGTALPGQPRQWIDDMGRRRSTAQLAVSEAWST